MNVNLDYSTLFNSLSSSNSSSSSSLSSSMYSLANQLSLVRSSTYRNVLKVCYSDDDSTTSSTLSSLLSTSSTSNVYTELKSSTDDLTESASTLISTGTDSLFNKIDIEVTDEETGEVTTEQGYDTDAIISAINDFVTNYNTVIEKASDMSDTSVSLNLDSMKSMTAIYEDALSEIGITIESDGTLSIDDETLENADFDNVKALFNGKSSFAYKTSQSAYYINQAATSAAISAGVTSTYSTYG